MRSLRKPHSIIGYGLRHLQLCQSQRGLDAMCKHLGIEVEGWPSARICLPVIMCAAGIFLPIYLSLHDLFCFGRDYRSFVSSISCLRLFLPPLLVVGPSLTAPNYSFPNII
ncbi:hypothetical protein BDV30DRAFT_203150 [Aspergillus minisclerotigenes]|uniref:Uncharacterized protein n=1 Tax=Aspergillus minisclerotigenes TaxID=656917 RepID=A0A5N6JI16_9EURO|nr:hypothetical protein BDV30DRAFT_203150 [Aspergillus minisclerotigenes]